MQLAWTLGKNIVIDESMILYNGRAISWVQYASKTDQTLNQGLRIVLR